MTRPQIIRADTLDLQDKTSPTAQDHSRQPAHPAPLGIGPAAPHQAAAVKHVKDERTAEEDHLSQAFNEAEHALRHELGSDDERTLTENGTGERELRRDEVAIRQNGGISGSTEDGDLADAEVDDSMDDDMMDKISSSPSIDDEDIDFEFVYALHTFVATVEGQANATKGDTMVLLDDSNSYWWLVRIVKDSSIGYLPAEHIETPTERLARLNKHRNIDLSASMLGDSAEKSKNPLKKAIRRRNGKTVQFAAPTYVEASDYDYSSDEEEGNQEQAESAEQQVEERRDSQDADPDEIATVEPLKVNGKKEPKSEAVENGDSKASADAENADAPRTSDEMFDRSARITRNGTLRNTDSFFKDDTAETRKITLTPNLLRDDSSGSTIRSLDKERGPSLDLLEKDLKADKSKDDKKKDKKQGMLSGLFKRKDKKSKGQQDFESGTEKVSGEISRGSPTGRGSTDASPDRAESSEIDRAQQPQRQLSKGKLHKRTDTSPSKQKRNPETDSPEPAGSQNIGPQPRPTAQTNGSSTMRMVAPEPEESKQQTAETRTQSPERKVDEPARSNSRSRNKISNMLRSGPVDEDSGAKIEKVKKAKQRVELDDFDSSPEPQSNNPFADPKENLEEEETQRSANQTVERLSESLVEISPIDETDPQKPPGFMPDHSSPEEPEVSPISPASNNPFRNMVSNTNPFSGPPTSAPPSHLPPQPPVSRSSPQNQSPNHPLRPAPTQVPSPKQPPSLSISTSSPSSSPTLPPWSDASLRSYMDDGSDIRNLLLVVHDVSGVVPAGPDHPIMAGLFQEERGKVADMGTQLDGLLVDWLKRKRAGGGSVRGGSSRVAMKA